MGMRNINSFRATGTHKEDRYKYRHRMGRCLRAKGVLLLFGIFVVVVLLDYWFNSLTIE